MLTGWKGKCYNIRRPKNLPIKLEEIPIKNG